MNNRDEMLDHLSVRSDGPIVSDSDKYYVVSIENTETNEVLFSMWFKDAPDISDTLCQSIGLALQNAIGINFSVFPTKQTIRRKFDVRIPASLNRPNEE